MTETVRKSGQLRLAWTIAVLILLGGYLFDLVAPRSFLAPYYLSLQTAILSGSLGSEHILYFFFLLFTGFVAFFIPSYFGLLLAYSFGSTPAIPLTFFPLVSILIPAKNNEKEIGRTLDCLLESDYPRDKVEIIVITSGSTDRTAEVCKDYASKGPVRLVDEPLQRKGKPAALNAGLASAKGELIAIYDGDTIVAPATLRKLVTPFSQPGVSAVTGPIQVRNEGTNKLTKGTSLEYTYYSGAGLLYEIKERLGQRLFLLGRNYCIRTELLKKLGGFEETSLTEDFSLMFKLREHGKCIAFSPKAVAKDIVPPTWDSFSKQRKRWAAGWNDENKKFMSQAKNKRKAGLSMINFLLYANLAIFTFIAMILAPIFWLLGDYLITTICLLTIIFTIAIMGVSVHKYGNRKYILLAYFPIFIFISLFMFVCAAVKPEKGTEWNKTPIE